jgi:uncharacterized protein YdhG (YjbR/CyaY superfamily)
MPSKSPDRSSFFPLIEKKHGKPMSHWFVLMKKNADKKYADQISLLRDGHGFSQAHANAVVMYCKGSTSSKRFDSLGDYLAKIDKTQAKTIEAIFAAIRKKYPKLEQVIAWNQPMLKSGDQYVFGLSTTKSYILLGPWSKNAVTVFAKELKNYETNKKTIIVPSDWKVDATLLNKFVKARLDEIADR